MTIPVYVIALKTSEDRRKAMAERLDHHGLAFQFIDAIHGASLPQDQIDSALSASRQYHHASPMSKGAIGGYMSHMAAWQTIADNDAEMALVLEDDAFLHDDIHEILGRITRLKDKVDIVNLHFRGGRTLIDVAQLSPQHRLTSCRYNSIGAESYIITKKAALHLLDHAKPIIHEVDLLINRWWDHGLNILTINPPVAHEDDSPTTIGYPSQNPAWPNDNGYYRFRRRLSRIMDSFTKRRMYPSMVATMKMRLMGVDPNDVGNNPQFPDLIKQTDE